MSASVKAGSPVDASPFNFKLVSNKNVPSSPEWWIALLGALFSSQVVQTWYSALQIVFSTSQTVHLLWSQRSYCDFSPIEILTMEEVYKRLLLTGWELLVSSFSLIFHLSFISVGLHYAPPLAQTQILFFYVVQWEEWFWSLKAKQKLFQAKFQSLFCIHLSFHGFLKALPTYSLGICAPTVFHHIYRSSHIWPRLKFNLNCPQAAAIEPCWHVRVLKCWNGPSKNNRQDKNIFSCELSLKMLMC